MWIVTQTDASNGQHAPGMLDLILPLRRVDPQGDVATRTHVTGLAEGVSYEQSMPSVELMATTKKSTNGCVGVGITATDGSRMRTRSYF